MRTFKTNEVIEYAKRYHEVRNMLNAAQNDSFNLLNMGSNPNSVKIVRDYVEKIPAEIRAGLGLDAESFLAELTK